MLLNIFRLNYTRAECVVKMGDVCIKRLFTVIFLRNDHVFQLFLRLPLQWQSKYDIMCYNLAYIIIPAIPNFYGGMKCRQ